MYLATVERGRQTGARGPVAALMGMAFLCLAGSAGAEVQLYGVITGNAIWSKADTPHRIIGDLTIESAASVTVEPGVQLVFDSGKNMTVNGQVLANGTAEAPITIGGTSEGARGNRITLSSSQTSEFVYCHFAHLTKCIVNSATPQANHLFSHCVLQDFLGTALYMLGPARVMHCIFRNNTPGNAQTTATGPDAFGIVVAAAGTEESTPMIMYNVFDANGLWFGPCNYANIEFVRYNRVCGGVGAMISTSHETGLRGLRILDCDLGNATQSVVWNTHAAWADVCVRNCMLSTVTTLGYTYQGNSFSCLDSNYWGTQDMDTIFGRISATPEVITGWGIEPVLDSNPFPQADVDGSDAGNRTTQADADLVKEYLIGKRTLSPAQLDIADVDRDGDVDIRDALMIESYVNGLIWKLPDRN